jgi:uncharacterized protein (TIGR02466 family)
MKGYDMPILGLFPTPVFRDAVPQPDIAPIKQEIIDCLKKIEDEDDLVDVGFTHKPAYDRHFKEFDSHLDIIESNLFAKHPFKNLEAFIYKCAQQYTDTCKWTAVRPNENGSYKIINSWINFAEKGVHHAAHTHPGYDIAGVFYCNVSPEMGAITFTNPNPMVYNCNFPHGQIDSGSVSMGVSAGDIILFPAWLQHHTEMNNTEDKRISIAFNLTYVRD